jgi:hypothetical protein
MGQHDTGLSIELPETPRRRIGRATFGPALLILLLYFVRFGYDYGVSDQGEFLPLLLHKLDPSVLASDWFVGGQSAGINVRSGMVAALQIPARIFPIWLTVALSYAVGAVLCVLAVFRIARRATGSTAAALLAGMLVLVLTPHWNLGGNEIMSSMLTPSLLAWGLGLTALDKLMERQAITSGALLGLAMLLQPLVALQLALPSFAFLLVESIAGRRTKADLIRLAVPLLAIGAWILLPLAAGQLSGSPSSNALDILTRFRAPHHYRPDQFPPRDIFRFGLVASAGVLALAQYRSVLDATFFRFARVSLFVIAGVLALSLAGTFIVEIGPIVKLQLFKLTVLAKMLLLIAVAAGLYGWFPERLRKRMSRAADSRWFAALTIVAAAAVVVLCVRFEPLARRTLPFVARNAGPEGKVISWIRNNTDRDAVFAVPPGLSGFRYRAERAVFVDFKAVPFEDESLLEWRRRLGAEAPLDIETSGGVDALVKLDSSFAAMSTATAKRLLEVEDVDYFLRNGPFASTVVDPRLRLEFQNEDWYVYGPALSPRRTGRNSPSGP